MNRTLAEQVYDYVRSEIISERLSPGTVLGELALAEKLGVSRGPVREAMGRLRADGLVEVRPRRGAMVASLSKREFIAAYQVRGALEVLAVTLATPKCTAESLAVLESLIDEMDAQAKAENEEVFFHLNRRFHRAICHEAGNDALTDIYERLITRMTRYSHRSATIRGDLASSVAEHRAIVDAMRRKEVDEASELMQAHIDVPLQKVHRLSEADWKSLSNPDKPKNKSRTLAPSRPGILGNK